MNQLAIKKMDHMLRESLLPSNEEDAAFSAYNQTLRIDETLSTLKFGGTNDEALNGCWILKNKNNWHVELHKDKNLIPVVNVLSAISGTTMYMRTIQTFSSTGNESLKVQAKATSTCAIPLSLTVSVYSSATLTELLSENTYPAKIIENNKFSFDGELEVAAIGELFVLLQFNFPAQNMVVTDVNINLKTFCRDVTFNPLSIAMHAFGPFEKASARLRCWKIAEAFKIAGHNVTVDVDAEADIYFFQKSRSVNLLKRIKNQDQAILVYDFDDNYFLEEKGNVPEFVSFINQMDLVTVGSKHLQELAIKHHPNVLLLENPADIICDQILRNRNENNQKIAWFGAPENISQLSLVDGLRDITTITQKGDIEFDIYTIDKTLCEFDLLLFPLELTPWNSAKNANRMIKSISLGIPFLASATDEHKETCHRLGLSDVFLVKEGESWKDKAAVLFDNYEEAIASILNARLRALDLFSAESIAEKLFRKLSVTKKRNKLKSVNLLETLANTNLISISPNRCSESLKMIIDEAEIHPGSFGDISLFTDLCDKNKNIQYHTRVNIKDNENVFDMYSEIDECIRNSDFEHLIISESGVSLFPHLEYYIDHSVDVCAIDLTLKNSNISPYPRDNLNAHKLITDRSYPKALLVRRSWLLKKKLNAEDFLSYFLLAIWLEALLCNQTSKTSTGIPVGLLLNNRKPSNITSLFYENLCAKNPELKSEIPSQANQWIRISQDIFNTLLNRHKDACPSLFANCLAMLLANEEKK